MNRSDVFSDMFCAQTIRARQIAARDGFAASRARARFHNPLLRRLEHVCPLSDAERQALSDLMSKPRLAAARTDILSRQPGCSVTLIISGIAARYRLRPEGQRRVVRYLLPGDLFDVHASCRYSSDWRLGALTPCTVVDIERQSLIDLAAAFPAIAHALWWVTFVELETEREWLVNVSRPADKRQAYLLCELLVRLQAVGLAEGNSFELRLTQADLADAAAVSCVHMNRVVQALRYSGLITYEKGRLGIPDVERLTRFAEFDRGFLHLAQKTEQLA